MIKLAATIQQNVRSISASDMEHIQKQQHQKDIDHKCKAIAITFTILSRTT